MRATLSAGILLIAFIASLSLFHDPAKDMNGTVEVVSTSSFTLKMAARRPEMVVILLRPSTSYFEGGALGSAAGLKAGIQVRVTAKLDADCLYAVKIVLDKQRSLRPNTSVQFAKSLELLRTVAH